MSELEYADLRGELLESIEHDQEEMRVAVQELTEAAKVKFDLNERIRRNPYPWLFGGALFGFWLGTRNFSPQRHQEELV